VRNKPFSDRLMRCYPVITRVNHVANDDGMLYVRRGVWRNTIGETKTAARSKPVPVIPKLRAVLEDYRASLSVEGEWIFSSSVGTPLDLDNLVKRVIQPSLHHCARCGAALGRHEDSGHQFQLDESRPVWHGYRV
jgi:integrase